MWCESWYHAYFNRSCYVILSGCLVVCAYWLFVPEGVYINQTISMIIPACFLLYFILLSMFSLVRHPVYYCILLVLNSIICCFICFLVYGFSWYALLFCLVYIGGVYILFVFVSVHRPKRSVVTGLNINGLGLVILLFWFFGGGSFVFFHSLQVEFRSFICTLSEGYFYVRMCLTLLFGFSILSLVMSVKSKHYR